MTESELTEMSSKLNQLMDSSADVNKMIAVAQFVELFDEYPRASLLFFQDGTILPINEVGLGDVERKISAEIETTVGYGGMVIRMPIGRRDSGVIHASTYISNYEEENKLMEALDGERFRLLRRKMEIPVDLIVTNLTIESCTMEEMGDGYLVTMHSSKRVDIEFHMVDSSQIKYFNT